MPVNRVISSPGLLAALLVACLSIEGRLDGQETSEDTASGEIETAPVELDGNVLFHVRGVSSFPALTRAKGIHDRLVAVAADGSLDAGAFRLVDDERTTRIMAGDRMLATVSDADARLEQVRRHELAAAHLSRLQHAIVDYREARSFQALRRGAVSTLRATLAFVIGVGALLWFWRRIELVVTRRLESRIHGVGIQSFELMRADRIWAALKTGIRAFRILTVLAAGFVYLQFALEQFAGTRRVSQTMLGLAVAPLELIGRGFLTSLPSLVFLAVLLVIVRLTLRLVALFFDALGRGSVSFAKFDREWAQPTYKMVRLAIVAFALIVAYPYIPGAGSAAFKGVSLFIGIVFSLGSTSAISNMIAGYMMTYRRAFKVGDRVKIGDAVGDIIETRLQVTHLRSFKNEELVVPNSVILASQVLNYSSLARTDGLILHTEIGIGYETPWRQVESLLLAAVDRTPGLAKEPAPFVQVKQLGQFAVAYELNAYCRNEHAMNQLYTALHRNILDVFNEAGVQIMTPQYEGDPSEPKIVSPEDRHSTPAFPATQLRG